MANGYLGKISAIVSANTADFDNKLSKSAAEVKKFAGSMDGTLRSAQSGAGSSLRGIYTDAQKLQRALTAVSTQKLNFSGFKGLNLSEAVQQMQAVYSVSQQIGKPLAGAAKTMSGLAAGVQAEFLPAMIRAQTATETLSEVIDRTGSAGVRQFQSVEKQVDRTVAAMGRMKEASSLVSGLATGQELRFQRPEMVSEMQRSASLQSQAAQMSPQAMNSNGVAGLVAQQRAAAVETERLAAALEREAQLVNGNVAAATAAYQSQLTAQKQLNDEIERRIGAEAAAASRSKSAADAEIAVLQRRQQAAKAAEVERQALAQKTTDNEIALIIRLQQAAKAAEAERLSAAQRTAEGEIALIIRQQQAAKAAEIERQAQSQRVADGELVNLQRVQQAAKAAEVERQAQSQRVADSEIANLQRVQQAAKAAEVERQTQSQRAADSEIANLQRVQQAAKAAEAERQAQVQSRGEGEIATLIRREQAAKAASLGGAGGTNLGLDIDAPRRQLDVLGGSISSLKSQIDTLPAGLRAGFVPAIRDAEQEFNRLSASATPLPAQIEAARQRLIHLEQSATRAANAMNFANSFGGRGTSGIELGLDQRALRGYEGELTALQTALLRTSTAARGPAVAAFNELRNAIAAAMNAGTLQTPAVQQNIARLSNAAVNATSQAGGGSVQTIQTAMMRAGDVGRSGVDRLSLGLNQLAFAFDDFMSSTGGWDQKLRAVSNNITQLGFVLGGATGLWIALGAVIAGQAAVGLYKFINGGRTAEDQTKALNDALARQKSLVEELAEAFKSLGDAMSEGTFSDVGKKSADFNRQMEDIKKKQTDSRKERVSYIDPDVQRERAEQNRLTREMEKTTDPGLRAAQAASLRESKEKEKRAMEAAAERAAAGATPDDIRRVAGGTIRETEFLEGGRRTRRSREQAEQRRAQLENDVAAAGGNPIEMEKVIQQRINERNVTAKKDIGAGNFEEGPEILRAREDVLQLERLLASLQDPIRAAIDLAANEIAESSRGPAEDIRNAQEEVADAIKAGIPGARLFGLELDKNAQAIEDAFKNLEKAAKEEDPKKKKELVDKAQAGIDELTARRAKIEQNADALRYERTVDPQRQMDARAERVGANLGDAGLQSGQIARRMREIENQRETIRQQASKEENQNPMAQRLFEQSEAALNAEVAAIEAATIAVKMFGEALKRASEEAKGNMNSAQQAADEARRADLGNSTPQTQLDRKRAEADLERQRQLEREAQTEINVQRDRQEQMAASPEAVRLQQINEELASGRDFDPSLQEQRGQAEADVAAAEESRQKFADVVAAQKAWSDATARRAAVEQEMGISELPLNEQDAKLTEAGRGDLVRDDAETWAEMQKAEMAVGLELLNYGDAIDTARLELAAAVERQAQAANALARIDEEIAASGGISGAREDLIRERDAIQAKMEDDARASQATVDAARDASTREEEQRKSASRGAEMARTPAEKFAAETDAGMTDIKNYYERRAEANGGLRPAGDAEAQAEAERRFNEDRARAARTETRAGRGRETFMTDRERFSRDIREGLVRDMTEGAIDQAGVMNINGRRDLLEKGIKNQMEEVAPMLAGFEEERMNARIQGPSRAALQMSDVSTSQGAAELTRLIRGDDSAKDVNLAELRKQTSKFDDLISAIKEQNPGVLL
jgi:hypothetical protein